MKTYNLIVAGCSISGVAAAVSAARQGLTVLLIEKSGYLGGAISNSPVFPLMPCFTTDNGQKHYLSTGIFKEILSRQEAYTHNSNDSEFNPDLFRLVLNNMITEARVDVLFHAVLFKVQSEGRKIKSVSVATNLGEMILEADFFIDATDKGDLLAFAGCEYQLVEDGRKLKGVHVLTAEELRDCTKFADSIACGNYEIDIHNPTGEGTSHYFFNPGEYYTIPYRSLLPKEFDNLLVAGRCISATHEAQASVRIMPICCCMGEAAGTAVSIAFDTKTNMQTLNIATVQRLLTDNGATIK